MYCELQYLFEFGRSSNFHLFTYLEVVPGCHARFALFHTSRQKEFSKCDNSNIVVIKSTRGLYYAVCATVIYS